VADLFSRERDPAFAPAGALLVSAVDKLIGLGVLPPLVDPLWDTSALIDDSSRAGGLCCFHRLSRASRCCLLVLAAYWATVDGAAATPSDAVRVSDAGAAVALGPPAAARQRGARAAAAGESLRRHARCRRSAVGDRGGVCVLRADVPAAAGDDARWYNNLAVLSQWLFQGVWWPFVICRCSSSAAPGADSSVPRHLDEGASRHGLAS
jgi:hypothetical protein